MSRYKQIFSLYKRKMKSGKSVFYYRTYLPDGTRTSGISTFCTNKTKAINYCNELIKRGILYSGSSFLFKDFAETFFNENSTWNISVNKERKLSKTTVDIFKNQVRLYILPFFGDMQLKAITFKKCLEFRQKLSEKFSTNLVNGCMGRLKVMLDIAIKEGRLFDNPLNLMKPLQKESKTHDSLSLEEAVSVINNGKWAEPLYRNINMISFLTGMRFGEVAGLTQDEFKNGYIDLQHQVYNGEIRELKTKSPRKIPLCKELYSFLKTIIPKSGTLLGSVAPETIRRSFKTALASVGIINIHERSLSFHSWRHTFNTIMLSSGIPEIKVSFVMGHSSGVSSIQRLYTNFKIEDYAEVEAEQKRLFSKIHIDNTMC